MSVVIDADQHLFEQPDMWRKYCDPSKRELAVVIEPDELGYWHLQIPVLKRRGGICTISVPGDGFTTSFGDIQDAYRAGKPSPYNYLDMPDSYWNPTARVAKLDEWGIDRALTYFQFGMGWPRLVPKSRVDIFRANMEAWNRWVAEVSDETKGQMMTVGTVTFRGGDMSWLIGQLEFLAAHGVKAALFTYG